MNTPAKPKQAPHRPAKAPAEAYGNVAYADPGLQEDGKKRYPVDTAEHVRAAWDYINVAKNAEAYSPENLAKVKANIKAAGKKLGVNVDANDHDADDEKSAELALEGEHAPEIVQPETPAPDAARKGTSAAVKNPEDAARKGTSTGLAKKNENRKVEPKVKTLAELRARLDEIAARQEEIDTEFRDAVLEDDVQSEWDGLETEESQIRADIKKIEDRQATLKARAVASPKTVERSSAPAVHIKQDNIYDLSEINARSYSGQDFLDKVRDNAKRAVEAARYGVRDKEAAQTVAMELLEEVDTDNAVLAKRYLATGSEEYTRAFGKLLKYGNDSMLSNEERAALTRSQLLGTDASGGYAVPFQLDPTVILTNAGATNPIRDLARVERIVGKVWQGVTSAGTTVSRGSETTVVGDNSFTLAQPTVSTNRVQGFVPFTIEIDLAWSALQSEITRVLVDAKAREEDSFITGDGTGTNPQGILTGATTTVTAGGTAAFAAADVYALHAALPPRWERNATFLGHKAIYNKVRQFDTSGGAQLWAHIGDGRPNGLMGYPASYASAMPSTLTTGNKILVLGDFSNFLIVDRIGMTVEMVPHLFDQATARPSGQRGVYAIWMNNSTTLVPAAFRTLVTG